MIAVADDGRRPSLFVLVNEPVNGLIPFPRRADQLAAQLIQQQSLGSRGDFGWDLAVIQAVYIGGQRLGDCLRGCHTAIRFFAAFWLFARGEILPILDGASAPSLSEISCAALVTRPNKRTRPLA